MFSNSFILKTINKLDIKEDSPLYRAFGASFFVNFLNKIFAFIQGLFGKLTAQSWFIANIDYFILALITLLLVSLLFAPTKIIGLLVGLCFTVFAVKLLLKSGERISFNTLDVQVLLYVFIVTASVAFSGLLLPAVKGYMKLVVYIGAYLVFFNIVKDKPNRSFYLLGILAMTVFAESMFAILQNFAGVEALATWQDKHNLNPEQIMTRVYGTLQPLNPNLLAGYLVAGMSAVAGIAALFAVRKDYVKALWGCAAFAAVLLAIVFTGSRGAYIGAGVVMVALFMITGHIIWHDYKEKIWLKKLWLYTLMLGGLAVLVLIFTSPALQHRIMSIFTFRGDSSNSFRMNVYIASIKMFLDNWLTGIGPGNEVFRLTYGLYMKAGYDALGAYSVPLEIAVESGIFALLAFFWLIAAIFLKVLKVVMYGDCLEQKILVAACFLGIVGVMAHGVVDTIFFRPQVQLLFWLFVAILGANTRIEKT